MASDSAARHTSPHAQVAGATTSISPSSPRQTPRKARIISYDVVASKRHATHAASIESIELESYIGDAKARMEGFCKGLWKHIKKSKTVTDAYTKMCESVDRAKAEADLYEPIDRMLNSMSLAFVRYPRVRRMDRKGIVFWFRAHDHNVPGSLNNDDTKPDRRCAWFVEPRADQENLIRAGVMTPWQLLVGVGEDKKEEDQDMGQIKTYMVDHRRYRIDYPVVRGFALDKVSDKPKQFRLRLTAMSSREFWHSPGYEIKDLSVWIAYLFEVYEAELSSIQSIVPKVIMVPGNEEHERDIRVFYKFSKMLSDQQELVVAPAFAKPPPGTTSFIGFAFDVGPSKGAKDKDSKTIHAYKTQSPTRLVKMSWQDATEPCHELRMYEAAHSNESGSWTPGLARHEWAKRLSEFPVGSVDPQYRKLYPEFTTLRSFGEPLSKCKTMRELFEVIYDACLTLEDMYNLGVLHRDISGRNILCHPVHKGIENRIIAKQRRCIDYVLGVGDETRDSRCLIVDLDHAALLSEATEPNRPATTQRTGAHSHTGTPMFMAFDFLNVKGRKYDIKPFLDMCAGPKFFSPDESEPDAIPDAMTAFARAFSPEAAQMHGYKDDGHILLYTEGELLAAFRKLHAHCNSNLFHQQRSNRLSSTRPDAIPSTIHGLRHDVESLVWVMTYMMARAAPKPPSEQLPSVQYGQFVRNMCSDDGTGRQRTAASEMRLAAVLHPDFVDLTEVLGAMHDYLLAIPWQRMEEDETFPKELRLHPAHAAVVMRRILLTALTNPDLKTALDIELNTTCPRELPPEVADADRTHLSHKNHTGAYNNSTQPIALVSVTASGGIKRSASISSIRSSSQTKRLRSEHTSIYGAPEPGSVGYYTQIIWADQMWFSLSMMQQPRQLRQPRSNLLSFVDTSESESESNSDLESESDS